MSANVFPLRDVWPGRNRPARCGLPVLIGPDPAILCTAFALVVALPTLALWSNAVPNTVAAVAVTVPVTAAVVLLLLCAAFVEPGIIPRQQRSRPPDNVAPEVLVGATRVPLQWCHTCLHWKPLRARHCREIDCCVLEMDHYCPWISNCVGARNYRFYVLFVWLTTLLDLYVLAMSTARSVSLLTPWTNTDVPRSGVCFALCLMTLVLAWGLVPLALYHVWLVVQMRTTHEHVRGVDLAALSGENPSCCTKFHRLLCSPMPKSFVDLKAQADQHGCVVSRPSVIVPVQVAPPVAVAEAAPVPAQESRPDNHVVIEVPSEPDSTRVG